EVLVREFRVRELGIGRHRLTRSKGLTEDYEVCRSRDVPTRLRVEVRGLDRIMQPRCYSHLEPEGAMLVVGEFEEGLSAKRGCPPFIDILIADGPPADQPDRNAGFPGHAYVDHLRRWRG